MISYYLTRQQSSLQYNCTNSTHDLKMTSPPRSGTLTAKSLVHLHLKSKKKQNTLKKTNILPIIPVSTNQILSFCTWNKICVHSYHWEVFGAAFDSSEVAGQQHFFNVVARSIVELAHVEGTGLEDWEVRFILQGHHNALLHQVCIPDLIPDKIRRLPSEKHVESSTLNDNRFRKKYHGKTINDNGHTHILCCLPSTVMKKG